MNILKSLKARLKRTPKKPTRKTTLNPTTKQSTMAFQLIYSPFERVDPVIEGVVADLPVGNRQATGILATIPPTFSILVGFSASSALPLPKRFIPYDFENMILLYF
ncbi:Oidioi.mRNA.OKI2018_I69.PAR.g13111.t1.cds [Oikopleura dioica]|uniref:Oidioi.mRNA.OKI2018_I69.PAR.g13111.t1.cds n=1 Tax=Oikopleura dioica TaxID=34765 RepID=A0ABN7S7W6_OIKDI|nr:Oidioi.mRNA.OKI2018_I69.PAR.g13111.t1.cds [Oikopleura dioica]